MNKIFQYFWSRKVQKLSCTSKLSIKLQKRRKWICMTKQENVPEARMSFGSTCGLHAVPTVPHVGRWRVTCSLPAGCKRLACGAGNSAWEMWQAISPEKAIKSQAFLIFQKNTRFYSVFKQVWLIHDWQTCSWQQSRCSIQACTLGTERRNKLCWKLRDDNKKRNFWNLTLRNNICMLIFSVKTVLWDRKMRIL